MTMDDAMHTAVAARLDRVIGALRPFGSGREYLNFAEKSTDPSRLFSPGVYERLQQVRAQYDPQELFRANHPVPPARP